MTKIIGKVYFFKNLSYFCIKYELDHELADEAIFGWQLNDF